MSLNYVKLMPHELQEKGEELANAVAELYSLRSEKKDSMNNFKLKIEAKEREISQLTEIVRTGKEIRANTFFDDEEMDN